VYERGLGKFDRLRHVLVRAGARVMAGLLGSIGVAVCRCIMIAGMYDYHEYVVDNEAK
jgi:hypothetical protein